MVFTSFSKPIYNLITRVMFGKKEFERKKNKGSSENTHE